MHKEIIGKTEFVFTRADKSERLMSDLYHLRYQVYCKECHFLNEEDYPNEKETDKFDPYSLHFVSEDPLGVIGTTRLVLDSPYGFPLEERCKDSLNLDFSKLNKSKVAEISRLAISSIYRRRKDDGLYYSPDCADAVRERSGVNMIKRIKPMTFGLYREMYQESKRLGITHWIALMERPLWILLRMHNFLFHQIGEAVDFHGPVNPYICEIAELEKTFYQKAPKLSEYFLEGLEEKYRPTLA